MVYGSLASMKPVKVSIDSLIITLSRSWRTRNFLICAEVIPSTIRAISQTKKPVSETQKRGSLLNLRWKRYSISSVDCSMSSPIFTYMMIPGVVPSCGSIGTSMAFMVELGLYRSQSPAFM